MTRFTLFSSKRYLPVLKEWTASDEAVLREWVGSEAYLALLKKLSNRMKEREAEGVTTRDVYKLERMEELDDLVKELELMQVGDDPKPLIRPATRLEDYQP